MTIDPKDKITLDIESYTYGSRFAATPYATKLPLAYLRPEWLKDGDIHILVSVHAPHMKVCGRLSISSSGRVCLDNQPKRDKDWLCAILYPAPRDADDWEVADWGDAPDQDALRATPAQVLSRRAWDDALAGQATT